MPLTHLTLYTIMASAIVVGAIRYHRLSISSRRMLGLLLVSFVVELLAYYIGHVYHTNKIVYNFFLSIQFTLFVWAYMPELYPYRKWLWIAMAVGILAELVSLVLYRDQLTTYYISILKTGLDVLIVSIILLYLRMLLNQPTVHSLSDFPLFWISAGWLLSIMLTTVGLSTFNYISSQIPDYALIFQQIRMVAEYQLYTLFGVAFLSRQRSLGQSNG
jgi:hypothetical protein